MISIHALLAESDYRLPLFAHLLFQFLSTLSLRRATRPSRPSKRFLIPFLSTLSLRRATLPKFLPGLGCQISIHALLAESDHIHSTSHGRPGISIHALLAESDATSMPPTFILSAFLSTLSLRRATAKIPKQGPGPVDFYPRSPCGERRYLCMYVHNLAHISIHALLAESDVQLARATM